jgi:hypothetical protein
MGFFHSIHEVYGKKPGEANGSLTYMPISKLNVKKLRMDSIRRKFKNSK